MDKDRFFSPDKVKKKSTNQEKRVARESGGKLTPASGALSIKGDVANKKLRLRIEAKRTDKSSMILEKAWLEKIVAQSRFEVPALNIEIQDQSWYLVRREEFEFILEAMGLSQGG